ncbi:MAG: CHC2 zinc finger domain-containing protein [Chloroflexota bacterium]
MPDHPLPPPDSATARSAAPARPETPPPEPPPPPPGGPPGPDPWARERETDPALRRASWLTEPYDDLLAEALTWRGLLADFREQALALPPGDPGGPVLVAGIEHASRRLADMSDALAQAQRFLAPGGHAQWHGRRDRAAGAVARLKERLDLADVVEAFSGRPLTRRGDRWTMRCPLPGHRDTIPSFAVAPDRQIWYCHGCRRGGDVITFVEEHQRLTGAGAAIRSLLQLFPDPEEAPHESV